MGYQKLSDGTWEQPAQAERRVLLRRTANFVAALAIGTASAASAVAGGYYLVDSNVMQHEQTDHDDVAAGLGALFTAVAVGGLGGLLMVRRIERDQNSLDKIRQDKRDGVKVVNGKAIVHDHFVANNNEAAPR